ncbi:hypothetical protein EV363DRAFT_1299220 [Boletus edulis]|nr:hypothetical protein EV363DRAFT_1299220 [Boletus edulis]
MPPPPPPCVHRDDDDEDEDDDDEDDDDDDEDDDDDDEDDDDDDEDDDDDDEDDDDDDEDDDDDDEDDDDDDGMSPPPPPLRSHVNDDDVPPPPPPPPPRLPRSYTNNDNDTVATTTTTTAPPYEDDNDNGMSPPLRSHINNNNAVSPPPPRLHIDSDNGTVARSVPLRRRRRQCAAAATTTTVGRRGRGRHVTAAAATAAVPPRQRRQQHSGATEANTIAVQHSLDRGGPSCMAMWSDTCCIDKSDHFILQEALVAMFKWYQGAAMMIVFLRGVRPSSPRGALARSIWNTRAWTLQEYIAAKVIRFYTEDWTLYGDLELPNHKESPEIISEMEQATGVSAGQLIPLRPGLGCIREKLCLASARRTTLVEDAAYSLLGIFSAIGIPAIYGEGEASLGRLLANVLTRSGDVSILAWTGESGPFNSCLPARITVYNGPATSHLRAPIPNSEMGRNVTGSHIPSFDLDVALTLYDRLNELLTPRFAESRMTLPCIAFKLPSFSVYRTSSGRVYRTDTTAFGMVEVRTRHDLSRMRSLYLVQPWLDTLLEHEDTHGGAFVEDGVVLQPSGNSDDEDISDEEVDYEEIDDDSSPPPRSPPLPDPVEIELVDRETGARRLAARLRQPFGALLLQQAQTGRRAMEYRRVASDCLITVRFQDDVSLADILDNPWYCSTQAFHGGDRNIHLPSEIVDV